MPLIPNRIADGTYFGAAWNKARESLRGHEPLQSPGVRTSHTVHGVFREVDVPAPAYGATEAASAAAGPFLHRLKAVEGDTLVCKAWDGTLAGIAASDASDDVYIAKIPKLRESIQSERIEGVVYTYAYEPLTTDDTGLNRQRRATAGAVVEICVVTPEWLPNDLIYAFSCASGVIRNGAAVTWLMAGDGRAWALRHE